MGGLAAGRPNMSPNERDSKAAEKTAESQAPKAPVPIHPAPAPSAGAAELISVSVPPTAPIPSTEAEMKGMPPELANGAELLKKALELMAESTAKIEAMKKL